MALLIDARLVGSSGASLITPEVDYDETFSPVVKPATVQTVLTLAVSSDWPVHQLDIKNVFLHDTLRDRLLLSACRLR
jgi:hypothetical protein